MCRPPIRWKEFRVAGRFIVPMESVSLMFIFRCYPVPQSSNIRPNITHLKLAFFTGGALVLQAIILIFRFTHGNPYTNSSGKVLGVHD